MQALSHPVTRLHTKEYVKGHGYRIDHDTLDACIASLYMAGPMCWHLVYTQMPEEN